MSKFILECHQLGKDFVDSTSVVRVFENINLQVQAGEAIAIMGRSGAGKSTLLHLLGGLEKPSHGEVLLNGSRLSQLNERDRGLLRNQTLGFVYQFHHLLPEFTALENVAMPLLLRRTTPSSAQHQAADLLDKVGLSHRVKHKPGQLSGGERQRVAIARALVTSPLCVLADEPTGNLDAENAANVMQLMLALKTEFQVSYIIVTHEQSVADKMERILILEDKMLRPQNHPQSTAAG